MTLLIYIFSIVAIVVVLGAGTLVAVDLALEKYNERRTQREAAVAAVAVTPVPVPPPAPVAVEVMPEVVAHIDAEEADEMISDALAMETACYEYGAGTGKEGIINLGDIDKAFNANDVITLAVLKERGMIPRKAGRMKILADGVLTKPFTVRSEKYSVQAIKMIELTGGTVIILKDDPAGV